MDERIAHRVCGGGTDTSNTPHFSRLILTAEKRENKVESKVEKKVEISMILIMIIKNVWNVRTVMKI